ncbi:HEAT repeat domain-containing protein [Rubripirellula tenax]|nr:HEAT repeat domain-containing protein [Rubripirellula tenax]
MPKLSERPRLPILLLAAACVAVAGCSVWRGKPEKDENEALRALMKAPAPPDLIREAAIANGMQAIQVDGVGAINGLVGTGGPADPSIFREQLLEEMKRRDIEDPNHFLESPDTALVRVQATIPPGARRGDPLDLRILAPKESRAEDLGGGWLLDTRLRQQMAVQKQLMQSSVRQSEVLATGTGPILTRAAYSPSQDGNLKIEGNVISGGVVQVSRKLALILRPQYRHVAMSSGIAAAINRRFFFFDGTTRRGIAEALEDDFVQLEVHPRYRDSIPRMMEVVRAIGIEPENSDTQKRLTTLGTKLASPATSADAALQLEALGESAVPTLLEGLKTSNPELKFYAAEALAYLDRTESVKPLEVAIRDTPAFRAPAMLALQGVKSQDAIDALKRLMDQPSMETRYGSFCSIRRRSDGRRQLNGQSMGEFWVYQVNSTASPAIVVSLRESPEIVMFGVPSPLVIPQFMRGPGGIMIKPESDSPNQLRISRFQVGKEDQLAVVDNTLPSLIAGLVSIGGGYGDVIEVLRIAKDEGYLSDQFAIDPLPKSMRTYYRDDANADPTVGDEFVDADQ